MLNEIKRLEYKVDQILSKGRTSTDKTVKFNREHGAVFLGIGITILVASQSFPNTKNIRQIIALIGYGIANFGLFRVMVAIIFEKCDTVHPHLTTKLNYIGSYFFPFGIQWYEQWKASAEVILYRVGIIIESISTILYIATIVKGVYSLSYVIIELEAFNN
ncbi:MAG: hypothetical protein GQ534_10525 [Candidatus Delongbacteria bacterium]|nr:hypothetical protein [Candidatus Delongbacteria bacterium]